MNVASKWAALLVVGALAACTQNEPFEDITSPGSGGFGTTGDAAAGSAADPASPVFFQQSVGDRVFFEIDQSTLTASGRQTLDAQANWLIQNTDFTAVIEGHADEQGTREYNVALGERRANAAREYLISRGIAGSRLKIVSFGKERPVEICSDEACYSKNRRAVTVLATGLTG
ncbi:MAG: peptidoglycan-associated lipoprotein Pal [Pseudomonadota bacterium]